MLHVGPFFSASGNFIRNSFLIHSQISAVCFDVDKSRGGTCLSVVCHAWTGTDARDLKDLPMEEVPIEEPTAASTSRGPEN